MHSENVTRAMGMFRKPIYSCAWNRQVIMTAWVQATGGIEDEMGPATQWRAILIVLLHALESLFKFRDQRSFTGLEAAVCHDAP